MQTKINKEIIVKNFSRSAHLYDEYAHVQRRVADELITRIEQGNYSNILEIGCGTGYYTLLLKEKFDTARIKAIDLSGEMIEVAQNRLRDRGIEFTIVDAEMADLEDKYDLITSNAAFQWLNSPEASIGKFENALTDKGVFAFSVFGPSTFMELKESLKAVLAGDIFIASDKFLREEEIADMVKKYFHEVKISDHLFREKHATLAELLKKIKYTGTQGSGLNTKFIWNERLLKKIEETYLDRFGGITATYQVFFCEARK